MKRILCCAAGLASAVVLFCASATAEPVTKSMELFNGKDFAGWTCVARDNGTLTNTWSITNGIIHCTGKPSGYLRTERSFEDYRLLVEWRFVKIAPKADNTGVLVHIQSEDKVWPKCVQCQGRHDAQGDFFVMAGAECKEHIGQEANTPVPKRGPSNEKPVGEWNTCEVVCSGSSIQAIVNGKLMNEITECTISSGTIGIQSEGSEMEIRKITIEPLSR